MSAGTKLFVAPDTTWKVDRKKGPFLGPWDQMLRIRDEGPYTVIYCREQRAELRTIEAHKLGFKMWKIADQCIQDANNGVLWNGDDAFDFVVMTINGAEIPMQAGPARQLASALLRRSDFVDDWQIANKARIVQ